MSDDPPPIPDHLISQVIKRVNEIQGTIGDNTWNWNNSTNIILALRAGKCWAVFQKSDGFLEVFRD